MESSPSSLHHLRAVEQLQKKTDELDRVFSEARRLERERDALAEQKNALSARLVQLEAADSARRAEFAELEAQVRRQQRHLQQYIEREVCAQRESKPSPTPRIDAKRGAELRELRERLSAAEAEAVGLRQANGELRREVRAARGKAAQCESTNRRAAADTAAMDEIEARALAGVKTELTALAAENARLLDELEAERRARRETADDAAQSQDLLRRQRDVAARQLAIAKEELAALGAQNDTLLEDLKRLATEQQQQRERQQQQLQEQRKRQHRRTVDRGVMTTTPLYSPPPATTTMAAVVRNTPTAFAAENEQILLARVRELEDAAATQARMLHAMETNERLHEERARLFAEERRELIAATQKGFDRSVEQAAIDTELIAVLEAVVDVLRQLVTTGAKLRRRLFPAAAIASDNPSVLPVVPCRDYKSPHLNAIFAHIGGMRHIATIIDELSVAQIEQQRENKPQQQQQQQYKKHIKKEWTSPPTPEKTLNLTPSSSRISKGNGSNSGALLSTPPPHPSNTSATVRDIGAWLTAREHHLERQLRDAAGDDELPPERYTAKLTYQSGETLAEAAKEVQASTKRSPGRHIPK